MPTGPAAAGPDNGERPARSTWRSASAATAPCCARWIWSARPASRCSASTWATWATWPRSNRSRFGTPCSRFLAGDYQVEARMTLDVSVTDEAGDGGHTVLHRSALNDLVLQRPAGQPHGADRGRGQRGALPHLRGGLVDRGHAHRVDRLQPVGPGPDRVAPGPGADPHPGRTPHALRPLAGARRRGRDRHHPDRRSDRGPGGRRVDDRHPVHRGRPCTAGAGIGTPCSSPSASGISTASSSASSTWPTAERPHAGRAASGPTRSDRGSHRRAWDRG